MDSYAMQPGYGPMSSILPGTGTRNFTEEANAHNYRNILAEQHVYRQEQEQTSFSIKQAPKVQLKSMSRQLVMKFMLHLHKHPKCLERTCGEDRCPRISMRATVDVSSSYVIE